MKINKNIDVSISFEELTENISDAEIIQLIKERTLDVQDVLDALMPDDYELFSFIGDAAINNHIAANIDYYNATSELSEKISRLEYILTDCEENKEEPTIPDNPELAKRFFCDLLNLGYHVSTQDILRKIADKITRTRHPEPRTKHQFNNVTM